MQQESPCVGSCDKGRRWTRVGGGDTHLPAQRRHAVDLARDEIPQRPYEYPEIGRLWTKTSSLDVMDVMMYSSWKKGTRTHRRNSFQFEQ